MCKGNLVRVHEELVERGAVLSYPALTGFCRRHGIGREPVRPVGEYHFGPGEEMQHDTSPHRAAIGDRLTRVETACLVACYSRMLFFQHYPRFNRFSCKLFLTEAAKYLGGVCRVCMVDNTHVIVASGTGTQMVPAPEMAAFADRLGFVFRAHERGDPDRKGRVERQLHFIENNFLAGRSFNDWSGLNTQARAFCDRVNARPKRHLHASPRELFAKEQSCLVPLPIHLPDVYLLHTRIVDEGGYVTIDRHRYSVPYRLMGRRVEVRETQDTIAVYDGPRQVALHTPVTDSVPRRVLRPEHRPPRGSAAERDKPGISAEEQTLRQAGDGLARYVDVLKARLPGLRATLAIQKLGSFLRDYPREAIDAAVDLATQYGLCDMPRLERMILKAVAHEYFLIPGETDEEKG